MPIATLTIDINAKLANLQTTLDKAAQLSEKSAKRMESAFSAVNGVLAGLGVGVSIAGIVAMTRSAIDAADAASDMSQRFGLAVEDIAAFDLAARQSGTTLEGVGQGLKAFSKFAVENGEALKQAGIDTANTREAFIQFADVIAGMPDGLEKNVLAQKAFGKAGADLIPMLNLGSQGLQEAADKSAAYAAKLAALAPQADQFNDKVEELRIAVSAMSVNMATAAIPALTELATRMAEATQQTGSLRGALASLGSDLGTGFLNSWRAIFKDIQVDLARFDLFVQRLKGDDAAAVRTQAHIKRIYEEMAALGGSAPTANPAQRTAEGMATGNAALGEQAKKYQALVDSLLRPTGGAPKPTRATPKTDLLGDFLRNNDLASRFKPAEDAIARFSDLQREAATAGADLTQAERVFFDLVSSPEWARMPEPLQALARSEFEAANAAGKVSEEQRRLNDIVAATPTAQLESFHATLGLLSERFEAGKIPIEKYREAIEGLIAGLPQSQALTKTVDDLDQFWVGAARNIQSTIADALTDGFSDGGKNILADFGKLIERLIAQAVAADLAKKLFGEDFASGKQGSSIGGWVRDGFDFIASLFASANGNAFSGSGPISAFASGGAFGDGKVLTHPTFFRYAQGGAFSMGVAGEAGPEGALPLKRMANGKLGVYADGGGGGGDVHVHITVPPGTPAEQRASLAQQSRAALGALTRARRYG